MGVWEIGEGACRIRGGSGLGFLGRKLVVGRFGRGLGIVKRSLLMIFQVKKHLFSCNQTILQ